MAGNDEASVTFRQSYRSDKLKSSSRKTLVMTPRRRALADPRGKIAAEADCLSR